ncbi:flagellar type III secretion system pore protein FliP [Sporichthya polymorpha]|uniref:flagellar type III secretion system pore protein FliP n=1 Tax=Sporichthya polymorpha TaxID=35751 RepID=UPI00036858F4|nr:flagellar type III secretion system pore protein FliP [Sporichthya polymorpha]
MSRVLGRAVAGLLLGLTALFALLFASAGSAAAAPVPIPGPGVVTITAPTAPAAPTAPNPGGGGADGAVTVDLGGLTDKPSTSITVIIAITLLSVAPALLLMMTSFTKIVVVLSLTRNALGLQGIPPNQVLAGLALFLSLFVMGPVLSQVNDTGIQPYLNGTKSQTQAFNDGVQPLREFMLNHTRTDELAMLSQVADRELPATREDVELTTLIPAFVLSELKSAFIIGFVIFVPFLIIDLVVSAALMSMGMMMLPPVMISLPFKILLFVLVDGWALIITALVQSYG